MNELWNMLAHMLEMSWPRAMDALTLVGTLAFVMTRQRRIPTSIEMEVRTIRSNRKAMIAAFGLLIVIMVYSVKSLVMASSVPAPVSGGFVVDVALDVARVVAILWMCATAWLEAKRLRFDNAVLECLRGILELLKSMGPKSQPPTVL